MASKASRARLGGVVVIGFSLLFLAIGGYLVYEQERALRSYESTEATVLGTEIDRDVDRDPDPGDPDTVTYEPIVEYRYRVDGQVYAAENVYPGGTASRSDRGWAEDVVDDYSQGETVTAYYDPSDPGDAYLVQKRDLTKFAFVVLPIGFLGCGALLLWRASWAGDDTGEPSGSVETATVTDGQGDGGASAPVAGDQRASGAGGPDADSAGDGPGTSGAGEGSGEAGSVEYGDWGGDGERE